MAVIVRRVGLEFKILGTEYIISLATSTQNGSLYSKPEFYSLNGSLILYFGR
jgi:hypothetical protein